LLGDDTLKTEANTNNLIGVPQNLLRLTSKHKYAVLELGSNHFGEIARLTEICQPDVGIITTIGGAHLEFFKDRVGVAKEKSDLFLKMAKGGTAIVPISEVNQPSFRSALNGLRVITFGGEKTGADWTGVEESAMLNESNVLLRRSDGVELPFSWQLKGTHQAVNASAALAATEALGVFNASLVADELSGFTLPGMRGAVIKKSGYLWINDAYNANAESTLASLAWLNKVSSTLKGPLHIVLGDLLELGDSSQEEHRKVLNYLIDHSMTRNLWLVGSIYESVNNIESARCFKDVRAMKQDFYQNLTADSVIFLKGSRGLKLELLIK
jgi:UDP-N-acetylmuramoyl-tripeptide--D-alanyl-D-alanine ligase